MYKNVLQSIDNVAIWPVISLTIFFLFFIVMLWWVFKADKNFIREMKNMPLNDSPAETTESKTSMTSL
ncbi:MAG: cbb3-type cytochrome c oxidase subunit 3 [Cyclobacteriaceae bacterium]|jgi:cbb3-type cytochrome oxidase subunit 3|nr:cbb3-type cytochrome c oxidase subunit 3 [Cyclobacteriaceae bacterium]